MGIKSLMKLLEADAPNAIKQVKLASLAGLVIVVDASGDMYRFMASVRHASEGSQHLCNANGENTSHLQGFFYRALRLREAGIKVAYVFDGKPPDLKRGELEKRQVKRDNAKQEMEKAQESGSSEDVEKWSKQSLKIDQKCYEEAKHLLELMGIPVIQAPGEAEAQCADMVKHKLAYATSSEDMDTLTFGSTKMLRYLTYAESAKQPIMELNLPLVLQSLQITMPQFIDLCILCGCDYTESRIKGIGPKKAHEIVLTHGSIAAYLPTLEAEKQPDPLTFPYAAAAKEFQQPLVMPHEEAKKLLVWKPPQKEALIQFLVQEKQFQKERVEKAMQRFEQIKNKGTQMRLDSFFVTKPVLALVPPPPHLSDGNKKKRKSTKPQRKAPEPKLVREKKQKR